jgi:hypothetical protein
MALRAALWSLAYRRALYISALKVEIGTGGFVTEIAFAVDGAKKAVRLRRGVNDRWTADTIRYDPSDPSYSTRFPQLADVADRIPKDDLIAASDVSPEDFERARGSAPNRPVHEYLAALLWAGLALYLGSIWLGVVISIIPFRVAVRKALVGHAITYKANRANGLGRLRALFKGVVDAAARSSDADETIHQAFHWEEKVLHRHIPWAKRVPRAHRLLDALDYVKAELASHFGQFLLPLLITVGWVLSAAGIMPRLTLNAGLVHALQDVMPSFRFNFSAVSSDGAAAMAKVRLDGIQLAKERALLGAA